MGTMAALAPEHLPKDVKTAFDEGASCMASGCFNAGAAMFRLCLDLATKPMLLKKMKMVLTVRYGGALDFD